MNPPISVTGTLIPRASPQISKKQSPISLDSSQGFTLFEILVVVVIVTISVSAILFSTSFVGSSGNLKLLGNDLGKTIRLLYQEAIFENKNFAISLNHQGYKVLEYDGQNWVDSPQLFFRKVQLGESQRSTLVIEELEVDLVDQSDPVPHILILSSGEMTPFEWKIHDSESKTSITIFGDFLGNILASDPVPIS